MNSSRVINTLFGFFGRKKNKLIWTGTLGDLKAFVLTIIDEQAAQSSKWHSPSGGKWCFNSEQLKVEWHSKSESISFDGAKANDLCDQIHSVLLKPDYQKKDQNSDLNKSLESFIADASVEACNINLNESPRLYTSLLQVSNVSCLNSKDINCDESPSNPEFEMANSKSGTDENQLSPLIQHTDERRDVLRQCEYKKHSYAHRGLRESETVHMQDPDATSGGPCCADCIKQRWEIDNLKTEITCLKKFVYREGDKADKSSLDMQISRLQRDNSTLIKTVEMLSRQLLNQNEENSTNVSSESDVYVNPRHTKESDIPSTSSKEKEKKLRKKKKRNVNESSSQSGVDPPKEIVNKAAGNPSTSTGNRKPVVVIAGDSIVKNVVGPSMSKSDADHLYVVKSFSGATISDMEDFIKPTTRKSPDKIILHVGTNDLKNSTPKVITDSILNLTTQIKEDSPNSMVGVSALLIRNDCPILATKVNQVNSTLENLCHMNNIPFLKNANINTSHLNSRGLHLNKLGSISLQNNFKEFINNLEN
ncbi:Furin [Paramuricea clavata]|uniref:Furin, partial n=1 Tax=Paramuricea clavata TaxID=317549 RepID=A0A6S7J138_PARCT|nr:Furin [Paramuricea clavata]